MPSRNAHALEDFDLDHGFLAEVEGARRSVYVPADPSGRVLGRSGPTVGVGVDLGGKDAAFLQRLGLSPVLTGRLAPYLGRRGAAAAAYVEQNPLTLSKAELDALNAAVQRDAFRRLAARFDAESIVGPFRALPRGAQTAIASLYFQYGWCAPERATPVFWRQITTGDWRGAWRNLQDFGDAYPTRRRKEAALLLRDLRAGRLPRPGPLAPTRQA
jgi:GH24 family phage-related lysozyme (muramidase)